jgi:AraC-like DNA-binding protein
MYEVFIPKSEKLRKHIHNICVFRAFEGKVKYFAFPQLGTTLAFFQSADVTCENNCVNVTKSSTHKPQVLVLNKYIVPLQLQYHSYCPEISINFKPTGLNYFFPINTSEIEKDAHQLISYEPWLKMAKQIFEPKTNQAKIELLEHYLIENLIEKDLAKIEECISLLDQDPAPRIATIAESMHVSVRTINRWFAEYIGCSPKDYKKIMRFRKAVDTKFSDSNQNLTEICLASNFYDPHFTREFKTLTQLNPRDFFSDIDYVANQNIPYKFF